MEKKVFLCLGVVALLAATGAWAGHHEGAMEKLAMAWQEAYNAGDIAAVAAMYAEDGSRMPPDMPAVTGREAIQAQIQGGKDAGLAKVKIKVVESKMVGDVGFARGVFEGMDPAGNSTGTGKWANAVKMVDGKMMVQYDIWNLDAPAPSPE